MPRFKKKSSLTLHRKYQWKRKTFSSPSPFKPKKRICQDPSPFKIIPASLSPLNSVETIFKIPPSPINVILQSPKVKDSKKVSKRKLHFEPPEETNNELEEISVLLKTLVDNGNFSTNNIAFKLFQDTLKWHACHNTSGMRYSDEVKEFFWTGRRLLGDQFLRFMRGFAHKGMVIEGNMCKGNYEPSQSVINFAVPSERTLDDYKPSAIGFSKNLDPGIIQQNIDLYAKSYPDASCVVMFDGKKIVPNSADVYLLDKEENPKLSEIRNKFENRCLLVGNLIDKLEDLDEKGYRLVNQLTTEKESILDICKCVLEEVGHVTKSLRQTYAKKKMYMNTLEKKFNDTNDGKFKYALNKIRTLQYQISICVKDLLEVVNNILRCCAVINEKQHMFQHNECSLNCPENYRELKSPDEIKGSSVSVPDESVPTNLLKQ